jgi:hypothetical protein
MRPTLPAKTGLNSPSVFASRAAWCPHDTYLYLLIFSLAGYATLGKGFAYVGYPPLLIGEVLLLLGVLVIYRSGSSFAMLGTWPTILLAAMLCLVALRTIPFIGVYGLDAVRDSVIVLYSVFAFTVIALILEKPERLSYGLKAYSSFAWAYGIFGGTLTYICTGLVDLLPVWPISGVPVVYVRLGEGAVHLSGVAIFVLLGLRRVSLPWVLLLLANLVLTTPSRGAMVSILVSIGTAALIGQQLRRVAPILFVSAAVLGLTYITDVEVPLEGGRTLGARQIVDNVASVVGRSDAANLDGTKEWRLRWWRSIEDYTFRGPYFWTGKGFGMGLAEEDGFVVGKEKGTPIVRSPHNAQYTMLARTGVPGLVLWVTLNLVWFVTVFWESIGARRRGDTQWANVLLWIGCYELAILLDASFDVALEGPMLGIWFWCLFGLGVASVMIYRWDKKNGISRQLM